MINFLKKYFFTTKNNEEESPYNSVLFSIDNTGQPFIKIRIQNTDHIDGDHFGKLLCSINDGKMQQSMIDVLLDISKQGDTTNKFVQKTLLSWRDQNTKEYFKIDLDPIIKPTDFNTIGKK
jgi:hypothetical protein